MAVANTGNIVLPIRTSAAATATTNDVITLPIGIDSWSFWVSCTAASGTSPTMDVSIQVTNDDGTTFFNTGLRYTQFTAAAVRMISCRMSGPSLGEISYEQVVAATGGTLAKATVLSQKIRFLATIGGTNPSFTYSIFGIGAQGPNYSY